MSIMCCVLFFFCKQKTAYEMRISDWSSDVCSSDLQFRRRGLFLEARNVAKLVEDVQRLCDQHLLDAGEVHVDDRLHRLPVGKLDVVEKAAPQKGVGQFLLVVRRDDDDRPLGRFHRVSGFVDMELHAVEFLQQVIRKLDVGLVDLVDQQHGSGGGGDGFTQLDA